MNKDEGKEDTYGDIHETKGGTSTYSYDGSGEDQLDDEESRTRLIEVPPDEKPESESELAMAVVDILACCDGRINPNQAKILQSMGNRFNESGSLINDEEKQERFNDEYRNGNKKLSFFTWFLPLGNSKEKYAFRSSSSISVGSLSSIMSSPRLESRQQKRSKYSFHLGAIAIMIMLIIACAITLLVYLLKTETRANSSSNDSNAGLSHPITDCSIVESQDYPDPLSQCSCFGSVTKISGDATTKYTRLLDGFGAEYLREEETINSCSARNQALLWLAHDPGSTVSEVLIQRHALVLFFIKLQGLSWTLEESHQKWLTEEHECTWHGITCDENKQVRAIELWDLNLDGTLPKEIMSLTTLERISLPENRIQGHLPTDGFVMMTALTDLTLFMNSITGTVDGQVLRHLTNLKVLNLDSNELVNPIPSEIGFLTRLEKFKIARNYIEGTIPTEIGNLKMLQTFECEENNISGTLPSEMGRLSQLEYLDMSWNNLQGSSIPWEFQNLRKIKDLLLKSNNFRGTLPPIVDVWTQLETLVLSLNALSGELPSGMEHMTTLTTLHLDGNRFNGTVPATLGKIPLLTDVRFNHNAMHGTIPSEIGLLPWLTSINLEGNNFSGTMPKEVCNLRGEIGTLETLTATCDSPQLPQENSQLVGTISGTDRLVCSVPDCCSSCA